MDAILSPKKLIKMARKWQKRAAMGRRKISYPRMVGNKLSRSSTTSSYVGDKGTFVVYTVDQERFVLPLSYLSNFIFQELFKMSEEEFGLSSSWPIILPCDSLFMNYIVSLLQRGKVLRSSITSSSYSRSYLHQGQTSQPKIICGY